MKLVSDTHRSETKVRVWDPFIRLFHWSLVAGMVAAWFTSRVRSDTHQWIGLGIGGLVGLRICWGFVGTRYALLSNFVRRPKIVSAYISNIARGTERRFLGHNPAGGAMIIILIITILLTVGSGWLMTTDAYYGDDLMQFIHSIFAYTVVLLVAFHLFGVALASIRHRENLIKAMVTGWKRNPTGDDIE